MSWVICDHDAAGDQGVADGPGVGYRAGQPVEFRDDQGVPGTDCGQRLVEAGPVAVGAGQAFVGVDPLSRHADGQQRLGRAVRSCSSVEQRA
jgi:hypothetical protein